MSDILYTKWPKCHSQNHYNWTTTQQANIDLFSKNLNSITY